jgi:hypothetical protein
MYILEVRFVKVNSTAIQNRVGTDADPQGLKHERQVNNVNV